VSEISKKNRETMQELAFARRFVLALSRDNEEDVLTQ
jgi:hypothetical protein